MLELTWEYEAVLTISILEQYTAAFNQSLSDVLTNIADVKPDVSTTITDVITDSRSAQVSP